MKEKQISKKNSIKAKAYPYVTLKGFNHLKASLNFIPQELLKYEVLCTECNKRFNPNWVEKRSPATSIEVDKGTWIIQSANIDCKYCNNTNVKIELPIVKPNSTYLFYGDEAYRDLKDKYIMTYTLVGNNKNYIEYIYPKVYELKKALLPNVDPESWKIHMKDLWNNRKKHKLFKDLTLKEVVDFSEKLSKILSNSDEGFVIYNVSRVYRKPKNIKKKKIAFKQVQNDCYSMLLMKVIHDSTSRGIIPYIYFDKSQKDGWAKDLFWGSMLTLLYSFMSKGIVIPEPKHVEPASHLYLELSDFVSIDIDPSLMGKIVYLGFNPNGNMYYNTNNKYPWDDFFKMKH